MVTVIVYCYLSQVCITCIVGQFDCFAFVPDKLRLAQ